MAMAANEIEALIKAALPDARVTVEDLAGDGDHYAANVVSETFRGILIPFTGRTIKRTETDFRNLNQALKQRVEARQ